MSEEEKKNRKFQFDLTKVQVDFEFYFAFAIGVLAIGYGLLSYYKDNLLGVIAADGLILFAGFFLVRVYDLKEKRFKKIRQKYIES